MEFEFREFSYEFCVNERGRGAFWNKSHQKLHLSQNTLKMIGTEVENACSSSLQLEVSSSCVHNYGHRAEASRNGLMIGEAAFDLPKTDIQPFKG